MKHDVEKEKDFCLKNMMAIALCIWGISTSKQIKLMTVYEDAMTQNYYVTVL